VHILHQVVLVQAGARQLALTPSTATYHQHNGGWWWLKVVPGVVVSDG